MKDYNYIPTVQLDPDKEYDNLNKSITVHIQSIYDKPSNVNTLVLGTSHRGSKIRRFSEDIFDPKLVPSYVKEVTTKRVDGKMYYSYVDNYGRED